MLNIRNVPGPTASPSATLDPIAEPLHRHALRLLRLLRREDAASGMSAARLSALSVLVFGGPATPGELAAAEQVSAPTMTRIVRELEREGWVRRRADPHDARVSHLEANAAAVRLLHAGRDRRLALLSSGLGRLEPDERRAIVRALPALERVVQALTGAAEPARARARSGRRRLD
jgi:DNA-binding MarR family transcriptional regulator